MTELLSRPAPAGSARSFSKGPARPLTIAAVLAALATVGSTLGACLVVAVVGWFLADAGAHGQTTDALRVGGDAWLVAHGSRITVSGAPLGVIPLTLMGLLAWAAFRGGAWAAHGAEPPEDDRALAVAGGVFAGIYVVLTVIVTVLVSTESAAPGLGRAILGALLLGGLFGTAGMASATGRLTVWVERVPGWVRSMVRGAAVAVLALVVVATVLVAAGLLLRLNEAASMLSALRLGPADYLMLALGSAAVAPNASLLGVAYLVGPGFAVGSGTIVAPTEVVLGPLPAFPLLAALPDPGPTPAWAMTLLAAPVLAAAAGAAVAQVRYGVTAFDSAALRGFGCGAFAAVLTTFAVGLAGGPMGTGRMADIGASGWAVLVAATISMSLGGLVSGSATAWWQRRARR